MYEKVFGARSYTAEVDMLAKLGLISADRLYEFFEAKLQGTSVVSIAGQDLDNGKECKLRTLIINQRGYKEIWASLTPNDTKNKTGSICVGIINLIENTFDRLEIPQGPDGYTPGKSVRFQLSSKGKGYGKHEKHVISREAL
jgi:hypothetical protein